MRTACVIAATILGLWAPGGSAQPGPEFTINAAMSKGPASAPVTIVEFSDYQ